MSLNAQGQLTENQLQEPFFFLGKRVRLGCLDADYADEPVATWVE